MNISGIDYLGIDRVLKRGTGTIIEENESAVFVRDGVSGAYMLACEDADVGASLLERHKYRGYDLLMVSDQKLGRTVFKEYGFSEMLECFQVAYYGIIPIVDTDISIRAADENDVGFLVKNYHLIGPDEIKKIVERGSIILGYSGGSVVGFIGEHLEGSMGLLYVFPEFRRKGFASALEKIYIAETMKKGFVPFGQVERNNKPSLLLQKKIGMTVSDDPICWMW